MIVKTFEGINTREALKKVKSNLEAMLLLFQKSLKDFLVYLSLYILQQLFLNNRMLKTPR